MTQTINFKFGSLIRTGPKLVNGGKWDAELIDWHRTATTNADLLIDIRVYFERIDPVSGTKGTYPDSDTGKVTDKTTVHKLVVTVVMRIVRLLGLCPVHEAGRAVQ